MAPSEVQRKLTAILCADVVGYSRLMGENEKATLRTLTDYRQVFADYIEKLRGRIVNAPGDSILAEFGSVVDAVEVAAEIQRELADRNAEMLADRRMHFRIGINLGDVMVQGEDLYGDGVNIAARLESLAEPGGICVSHSVYDLVRQKLKLHFEYMGEQQVKNIVDPVRAYQVLTKPGDAAHRVVQAKREPGEGMPRFQIPDQPSIAVLPFTNLSGDPEQEYFGDGLTEDIITDLSHLPGLLVIARNSTFTYKGRAVTSQQVGEELGVRYVLEGSVRKSGDSIRITAQLIEAANGHHLWAKRYDRGLENVFSVQDELTKEIVTALDVELVSGEIGRHLRGRFTNPVAGEAFYRSMAHYYEINETSDALAKNCVEQFIGLEPDSVLGYAWAARLCLRGILQGWSESREASIKNLGELLEKAFSIDSKDPLALCFAAMHQLLLGNHDQGITHAKQAQAEGPGLDLPYEYLGWCQMFDEKPLEAIENMKRGLRLSPIAGAQQSTRLGTAYRNSGQLELAVDTLEATVKRYPAFKSGRVALASSYSLMGKDQEAKQQITEILRLDPAYTIARYTSPNLYRNNETMEKWADSLRIAGLPE